MTDLQTLFSPPSDPSMLVLGQYSAPLVLLAVGVAVFASWMALQMAGQARRAPSRGLRVVALCTGSLALGAGVWAMHFVGMLAFTLCVPVVYDPVLTAWSLLPSLGASFVALRLMAQPKVSRGGLAGGAVLVGLGIGAMHYAGMAAMRMALSLHYSLPEFVLSIVVAAALAWLALWVRFGLAQSRLSPGRRLFAAALVMGCAISGMHFMGMAAARFVGAAVPGVAGGVANGGTLALQISVITAAFTAAVAALNGWLRYREMFQRVRSHEQRERGLLAEAADGVLTLDADGVVLDLNPAAERLFGLARAQALGREAGSLLSETEAVAQRARTGITGRTAVMRAHRGDGSELTVRAVFSPRQQVGGDQCLVFVRDISAHFAMQQALEDSERQLRSLIGSIPGIAYRLQAAPGWPVLYMSEGIERLLGCPAEEFIGPAPLRSLARTILIEDRPRVLEEVRAAERERRAHLVEFRMRRPDGSICWLWSNGRATYDAQGRAQWIDGVIMDITARKEAELALRHYQALVEDAGDAIASTNLEGRIISWNKGAEKTFGYTREEVLGRRPGELTGNPAAPEETTELLAQVQQGQRVVQHEARRRRKDGKLIDIDSTLSPIRGPDGGITGVAMIGHDITERLYMEADLRAAKVAAEKAAQARTDFLANMSHEIRTPMNAVLGFTEVLLGTQLAPQQRRHLDIIRDSGRSLLHLLNEVLDVAKLDRGAVELEPADFSLLGLIDRLTSTMGYQARAKGLEVKVEYAPDLPAGCHGDELRLRQILINLLGNAIKFTAAGSVTLSVARGSDPRACVLHFTVSDTGIGIAPERLSAIFDPFTQADASMSRRYGGTGLGTTIAKQLTELMGGRIWAESTLGEGSAFHVLLPLEPARAPLAAARSEDLPALKPLRLLAVDDVPQNLELLSLLLEAQGHQVLHAGGGAQAVRLAAQEHFDAVLMDVHMPGMDGLEATRNIRVAEANEGKPRVPVVALTASVQETDLLAARAAGMDGFAAKPVELPALLGELARVLGLRHADAQAHDIAPAAAAQVQGPQPEWVGESEMASRPPLSALAAHAGHDGAQAPLPASHATASALHGAAPASTGHEAVAQAGLSGCMAAPVPQGDAAARIAAAPVLDYAAGLQRCGGKESSYLRFLGGFAERYAQAAQTIPALVRDSDWAGARDAAHRLRGIAANLGLQALWLLTSELEQMLSAQAGAPAPDRETTALLALLGPCTTAALQAITAARAGGAAAVASAAANAVMHREPPPLAAEPVSEVEALGAALLHSFRRGAIDDAALANLLAALGTEVEPAQRAGLQQAVDNFDFSLAHGRLEALLAECGSRRAERS